MFFKNRLVQIYLIIFMYICPLLSYNYQKQHPSSEILAKPGFLPRFDKLLNRYGSMHTMREYIYWATKDEIISNNLRKKLTHVLIEKTLVEYYFKSTKWFHKPLNPKNTVNLASTISNRIRLLKTAELAVKGILNLHRKKMYGLWADSRDLYLSVTGLLMFQKMYLWSPVKIIKGIDIDTSYQARLTHKHASVIGTCSLFRRTYTFSVEWFEVSEAMAQKNFDAQTYRKYANIAIDVITQMRDLSIQEHNIASSGLQCWLNYECHMYLFIAPILYTSGNAYLTRTTSRKYLLPVHSRLGTVGLVEDQLINLCSVPDQSILPSRMQINLRCYYEKYCHPYLYIGPIKTEELSESPIVFQYYDILGPNLMHEVKSHFIDNAELISLVKNVQHYNGKRIIERVEPSPGYAKSLGGKYVGGHPIFTKLAEIVTGIKFDGPAEKPQYMDYTPGRVLRAHDDVDWAHQKDPEKEIDGNKFADLLYYLEVPDLGGHTPFCQAGVKAYLVKGSMVIWVNKFRNGTNRDDVYHGGCPVIHGNKMILAQALDYIGQENHFKCTLNRFE